MEPGGSSLGHDPTQTAKLELDPGLFDFGVLLFEIIAEPERHDGESLHVEGGIFLSDRMTLLECIAGLDSELRERIGDCLRRRLGLVDVGQAGVVS